MNLFFSDIELEIGKILAEHPEREDNAKELFEEVSGIKLEGSVNVHLHYYDGTNYSLILPPSPDAISALSKENKTLAAFLRSSSIDPTASLEEQQPTLAQFAGELIASDAGVLEKLKQSPKDVLEKYMEGNLPDGLVIKVIEFSGDGLHLSVPNQSAIRGELGEADLAQVAGGVGPEGGHDPSSRFPPTLRDKLEEIRRDREARREKGEDVPRNPEFDEK